MVGRQLPVRNRRFLSTHYRARNAQRGDLAGQEREDDAPRPWVPEAAPRRRDNRSGHVLLGGELQGFSSSIVSGGSDRTLDMTPPDVSVRCYGHWIVVDDDARGTDRQDEKKRTRVICPSTDY